MIGRGLDIGLDNQGWHIPMVSLGWDRFVQVGPSGSADYGGALHIIGTNDACSKIEATSNSLVVFDVTTQKSHYVADIRSTAGDQSPVDGERLVL